MEAILLIIMAFGCISCFMLGAKVGQAVKIGKEIELPKLDPLKQIKDSKERKLIEAEQRRLDAIMRNIESYDGTAIGQEDLP